MPTYTSHLIPTLKDGDKLVFTLKGEKYCGTVVCQCGRYFVDTGVWPNSAILRELYGSEYRSAVLAIYGYKSDIGGDWPYTKALEDLTRLVRDVFKKCEAAEGEQGRKIEVGMLIRGLRADQATGVVTNTGSPTELEVRYSDLLTPVPQTLTDDAEVKWPWEADWTPVAPQAPNLAKFQIWKSKRDGDHYIALETCSGEMKATTLYYLGDGGNLGSFWDHGKGFSGDRDLFEFVGMAKDVLTIKKKD